MKAEEIQNIIFQEPKKTFTEILKVHNKEVPFANLLAFFFSPKEKHSLGTLFINSFIDTAQIDSFNRKEGYKSVEVHVEKKTTNGNRIDILIITDTLVICIEFKINHHLNNPLQDYKDFINEYPDCSEKQKYYFVLTPFKKEPTHATKTYFETNNDFQQIMLSHFVKNIKTNLPNYIKNKEDKNNYYPYFEDFIQTIENRKIRSLRRKELTDLNQKLNNNGLKSIYHLNNQGGFLEIKGDTNALKIRIKNQNWQIEKWEDRLIKKEEIILDYKDLVNKTIELTNSFLI